MTRTVLPWALVAVVCPALGGSAELVEIPLRLTVPGQPESGWVSARAARVEGGVLDWQSLGEWTAQVAESLLGGPRCSEEDFETGRWSHEISVVVTPHAPGPSAADLWLFYGRGSADGTSLAAWETLSEAHAHAWLAVTGEVVEIDEGFFGGDVGSVLAVKVTEVFKGSPLPSTVFLYYPEADFRLGAYRFLKSNREYPPRPKIGDRLLVLTDRAPNFGVRVPLAPRPEALWIERASGETERCLGAVEAERGLEELAGWLRLMADGGGAKPPAGGLK